MSEKLTGRELCVALELALGREVCHCDLNAMHEVEREIELRGLEAVYVSALLRECTITVPHKRSYAITGFACAHATAEQRARAALAVLLETSQR